MISDKLKPFGTTIFSDEAVCAGAGAAHTIHAATAASGAKTLFHGDIDMLRPGSCPGPSWRGLCAVSSASAKDFVIAPADPAV